MTPVEEPMPVEAPALLWPWGLLFTVVTAVALSGLAAALSGLAAALVEWLR